jgi:pyruvate/2-oxoglutarate/acetoin dehydrogenase E1 component
MVVQISDAAPTATGTTTYVAAIREALLEEMRDNERVVVLGEDIQEGGVFRVT